MNGLQLQTLDFTNMKLKKYVLNNMNVTITYSYRFITYIPT